MGTRLRRLTGFLLLGVFFATFAASISAGHVEGQDDVLCLVAERGDGPATIKAQTSSSVPGHCAVCHWVRALSSAASFGPAPAMSFVVTAQASPAITTSGPIDLVSSQSAPRAPPALRS